jgi:hypothetical protein
VTPPNSGQGGAGNNNPRWKNRNNRNNKGPKQD